METQKLKAIIYHGLTQISEQHTKETLGDRSQYLGASDIGHCPRKVIMERINKPDHDLATLLRFRRGHVAEDVIADIYTAAGFKFERQVEVDISTESTPILVHIDFVFTSKDKVKYVLEVKSGNIPDTPYGSWESQLHLQMGALARKYPDHTIKGVILSIDLSKGDVEFFNSYTASPELFNGLVQKAESIWNDYQLMLDGQQTDVELSPGPLCGFCSVIKTCPAFEVEDYPAPEMDKYIHEFQGYRNLESEYKTKVSSHKESIRRTVSARGPFRAGGFIFKNVTRSRKNLDKGRLEEFLNDHGTSYSEFEEPSSYTFLDIKKLPKGKKAQHKKAA